MRAGRLEGYLCAQPQTIGPWAARSRDGAEALLAAALRFRFEAIARVLAPGDNRDAPALLRGFGFLPATTLRHVRRGGRGAARWGAVYGKASYCLG